MGKKDKPVKRDMNPTTSIVTITQLKRFQSLEILHDLIKDQTYDNIVEWVIIEGSKTAEDAATNAENIAKLKEKSTLKFPIVYLEWVEGTKLGALRNRANKACVGNITVVMDDDDYYPPKRVEHAVEKLALSNALIAGCSGLYVYDYMLQKLYQFRPFGPNHSTNTCMAWKKEYLEKNSHDPEKESGEEASFTNNFTEKMVQLDADKTLILSGHGSNTYNKRELLVGGTHKINQTLNEISQPITGFIKEPYYSRMRDIFYKEYKSEYDIVYFAGGFSIKWDPKDKSLGGSEQAIVHLASTWASLGKKVAVYGEVPEVRFNNVDYFDWKKFPFEAKHDTVILWRLYGLMCGAPFPIKANRIWLDLHDGQIPKQFVEAWFRYGKVVNKIMFKSEFHKSLFEKATFQKLEASNYAIIPNGVRIDEFLVNKDNVQRNPFRFCYCSCYRRGLGQLLQYVWPIIYSMEPRAELHVYYGMNNMKDEEFKKAMTMLLSQPGVMDHGRQPMDMVIREKYMSSFHLYITNTVEEIDCISIRESLVTGAIPLISNSGIFKERDGIHFEIDEANPMSYTQHAFKIIEIMKDPNIDVFRQQLKRSGHLITWTNVAARWLQLL